MPRTHSPRDRAKQAFVRAVTKAQIQAREHAVIGWRKSATEVVIQVPGRRNFVYITKKGVVYAALNRAGVPHQAFLPVWVVLENNALVIVARDNSNAAALVNVPDDPYGVPAHPLSAHSDTSFAQPYTDGYAVTWDGDEGAFVLAPAGAVTSVNGQTGVVVLNADHIDDTATTNKFATAAELSKLAGIEPLADVTDAANVAAAGALMTSGGTMSGAINMGAQLINNLATPVSSGDAATKAYVDATANGLDVKASVRVATTANITLSGPQTIDGVSVIAGDRVLVKNQSTAANNGIYVAAAGAWARASDADANAEVTSGLFTFVTEGTVNGNTGWALTTDDPITLGTTALAFSQFSGPTNIAAAIDNASETTTPVAANKFGLVVSGVLTWLSWTNLLATAKSYFDTLYQAVSTAVLRDGTATLTADWDVGEDRRIKAEAIRARDAEGLRLENSAGTAGVIVEDDGSVDMATDLYHGNVPLFVYTTRAIPTVVNDYIELGSIAIGILGFCLDIAVNAAGLTITKRYLIAAPFNATGSGVWATYRPYFDTGVFSGQDFAVDVSVVNGRIYLRIRRVSGATTGTLQVTIWNGAVGTSWDEGSGTGSMAAPTIFFGGYSSIAAILRAADMRAFDANGLYLRDSAGVLGLRILHGGFVGAGVATPLGKFHWSDGVSSGAVFSKTSLDATVQTVIPDGTGDIVRHYGGQFILRNVTTGALQSGALAGVDTPAAGNAVQFVGPLLEITLSLSSAGALTVFRNAGTDTYTLTLDLIWQ